MKKIAYAAGFVLAMTAPALADPVEGLWKTQPGDEGNFAYVRMTTCGASICGVIESTFDENGEPSESENLGKQMVWDMVPAGDGSYTDGKIWAPDRDKTYKSNMQLNGDMLVVEGCVLWICRGQDWTRVSN